MLIEIIDDKTPLRLRRPLKLNRGQDEEDPEEEEEEDPEEETKRFSIFFSNLPDC